MRGVFLFAFRRIVRLVFVTLFRLGSVALFIVVCFVVVLVFFASRRVVPQRFNHTRQLYAKLPKLRGP